MTEIQLEKELYFFNIKKVNSVFTGNRAMSERGKNSKCCSQ